MTESQIAIVDFGVSTYTQSTPSWVDNHPMDAIQSSALRAPEVTIGADWDAKVDIWSLGCLVIEFVQGFVLFAGQASKNGSWTRKND
ncbi:Protein kinase-like domain protein [Penicillium taxi]|uniref:Protein kinase-like domain protein n=1 Tax=Penicillium taxi TaxID=168475 RepID=UPI0025455B41|nr:Protein kinase-like domain protein [Penicillium taxi]KAJ5908391.1 Protein kinase-like domain protein [Penicillium taxi]